jgi:hypothetical protein
MYAEAIIGAMTMITQMDTWLRKHLGHVDQASQESSNSMPGSSISAVSLSAARVLLDTILSFSQIVRPQTSENQHGLKIYGITFWPHAAFFALYQNITHHPPHCTTPSDLSACSDSQQCQGRLREGEIEDDAIRLTRIAALLSEAARTMPQYSASAAELTRLSMRARQYQILQLHPESKAREGCGDEFCGKDENLQDCPELTADGRRGGQLHTGLEFGLTRAAEHLSFGLPSAISSAGVSGSALGASAPEPWDFLQGDEAMDLAEVEFEQFMAQFGDSDQPVLERQQEMAGEVNGWDWEDAWPLQ